MSVRIAEWSSASKTRIVKKLGLCQTGLSFFTSLLWINVPCKRLDYSIDGGLYIVRQFYLFI